MKEPDVKIDEEFSDSEHVASKSVATSMSVGVYYGAFSAAASMKVSDSSKERIRTVRVDSFIKSIKYTVQAKGPFGTTPEKFLTKAFIKNVKTKTVEEFDALYGSFYAKRFHLGGEVRKSYIMQVAEDETEKSVKAELKLKYGTKMMGASASFGTGLSTRESNRNCQMKTEFRVKGGDTSIWLGKSLDTDDNTNKVQGAWAATVGQNNFYPFDFELDYVWNLTKKIDMKKGLELEEYLVNKWNVSGDAFKPTEYAKSK
jgi:hypothetical protein